MCAELQGFVALHPSHVWLLSSEIPDLRLRSVSWGRLEAGQDLRGLGFVTNFSVIFFFSESNKTLCIWICSL